jgi:hypothetical protein
LGRFWMFYVLLNGARRHTPAIFSFPHAFAYRSDLDARLWQAGSR